MKRRQVKKKSAVALAAVAALTAAVCAGVSPDAEAAGERHYIDVRAAPGMKFGWRVSADLYDGKGNKVYHWQEKHDAGKGYVHWEFTDGGDGGHLNIWINPGNETSPFSDLSLDKNRCFEIGADSTISQQDC